MRLGYLMNAYPMVSTTFIGREIEALEDMGFEVERFAIRRWDGRLIDPADIAEAERSDYLLEDGAAKLVWGLIAESATNPRGLGRAVGLWRRLWLAAGAPLGAGLVRHVAYLLEAVALRRRLRRHPADHVHVHFSTNSAAVAMMAHAMGGPSYSFTVHGPDELFDPEGNALGLKIENAAFVACISHFCRSQCMIFAPVEAWDRLRIVHCGVRPDYYAALPGPGDLPEGLPPRPAGGRAVFVARLSKLKGGLGLVEAMARLRDSHPQADLVIVGDGELCPRMEAAAAEAGIADRVHFLGFCSQTAVRAAMADADMLVLPSFAEGVPVVLMEAMASGKPVIASRVAGVAELVEDGVSGYVVPPGDTATLAARMGALLDDADLRARMGAAGREKVKAEFDLAAEAAWLGRLIAAAGTGEALPEGLRPDLQAVALTSAEASRHGVPAR